MRKKLAVLIPLLLAGATAQAESIPAPKFFGELNIAASSEENRDFATEVAYAEFGARGMHNIEGKDLKVRYELGVDYSATDKSTDEIRFKRANFLLLSKKYGAIFFGDGASGIHNDLYSRSDIFFLNNQSRASKNASDKNGRSFFAQPDAGSRILSWGTPKLGNFNFKMGVATLNEDNSDDADGVFLRSIYQNGALYAAVHVMKITEKQSAAAKDDYIRSAATISYAFDNNFTLTALVENNKDNFGAPGVDTDNTSYALTGTYTVDAYQIAAQYQGRTWSDDTVVGQQSESLTSVQVQYNFDKYFSAYAEAGVYSESYEDHGDKYGVGLRYKF